MARRVAVINFKGGVGKTTLAFHLAAFLTRDNKRVLVVDVDHQSSLSFVIMGGTNWDAARKKGTTSNRIFESFCNRKVAFPGAELIHKNPIAKRSPEYNLYPTLDLVPAQFELDDTEIELASTTVGGPTVSEWEKRTLLASWLDAVNADANYEYILFDCPPATKLVSQNAVACSHGYILPVIPDELSTRGVTHFTTLVDSKIDGKLEYLRNAAGVAPDKAPAAYVVKTKLLAIVPSMAKTAGNAASGLTDISTSQLAQLRANWGTNVTDHIVKHLIGVPRAMNWGWPVWNLSGSQNITPALIKTFEALCQELKDRIDK